MPPLNTNVLAAIIAVAFANIPLATTTLLSSVTLRGVTFTFDKPMPVCYSCLGEPAVISSEAFQITSITPVSEPIETSTGSGIFHVANGAMLNPSNTITWGNGSNGVQGFDGLIGVSTGSGQGASATAYNAAANVDPAISGAIAFTAGATGSVVKSVRRAGVTNVSGDWRTVDRYVVLSVLSAVPYEGFFRPPVAGTNKTIKSNWREAVVNYGCLNSYTPIGSSGSETNISQARSEEIIRPFMPQFGNGEKLRRFMDTEVTNGYSQDIANLRNQSLAFLNNSPWTNAEKRTTFLRVIQFGIDTYGEYLTGWRFGLGAGQYFGYLPLDYYAAFGLLDNDLLTSAQSMLGREFRQHFWVDSSYIGFPTTYPRSAGQNYTNQFTYIESDLGVPEWTQTPGNKYDASAMFDSRYRGMFGTELIGGINTMILKNGPGGINGVQAILAGGPDDSSNQRAAALNYFDRVNAATPDVSEGYSRAYFDSRRALVSKPQWTARPDWILPNTGFTTVTAITGGLSYSFPTFSTLPVTRRDVRYSLDGIQWVEVTGVNQSGSVTGLTPGLAHRLSYREVNAAGVGRWSTTEPQTGPLGSASGLRATATPTGTLSNAAPVVVVDPKIFQDKYDLYTGIEVEEAPATLTTAFMQRGKKNLYMGAGYVSGFPAPEITYEWTVDGSVVFNSNTYSPDWFVTAGKTLTGKVTYTNSQGSVSVTKSVNVPAEVEPPAEFNRVQNLADDSTSTIPAHVVRNSALTNCPTNSAKGTIAFKGKLKNLDGQIRALLYASTGSTSGSAAAIQFLIQANNSPRLILRPASTNITLNSSATVTTADSDVLIVASWDLSLGTPRMQIWVNGTLNSSNVAITSIPSPFTNMALLSGTLNGAQLPKVELDYLYLNIGSAVDLSVSANLVPFQTAAGMGGFGDEPTGTRPHVYLNGDAEGQNTGFANRGIGGIFTPVFQIYNNTNAPDDPRNGEILNVFVDIDV